MRPTVAILGLGAIGHAFAENLLNKGFKVFAWNRTLSKGENLLSKGLKLKSSIEEAVISADVIISILSDEKTTLKIAKELAKSCSKHVAYCQMGTIGVNGTKKVRGLLKKLCPNVTYIDAPISGTKAPAQNAQITIFASPAHLKSDMLKIIFDAISRKVIWFDNEDDGQKMKLVVNSILVMMMEGIAESMQLADIFGFSCEELWSSLEDGPLSAPYIKGKLNIISNDDYEPQMELRHALKDVKLALKNLSPEKAPCLTKLKKLWQNANNTG